MTGQLESDHIHYQPPFAPVISFLEGSPDNFAFLCSLPLADEWKTLGTNLFVSQYRLDIIQSNNAQFLDHSQRCLTSLFEWWFINCGETTCEVLIQAVKTMGKTDVVEKLCEKYGKQLHT